MKKLLAVTLLSAVLALPVLAEEEVKSPDQKIVNTKSYTGFNYDRQDSETVGTQRIVNDHSWFNINIQIVKKGVLLRKDCTSSCAECKKAKENKKTKECKKAK